MVTAIDIPVPHHLREKTVLQSTNRKLERRVKELSIQIDDERQHVNDQKDQVRTLPGPGSRVASIHCALAWRPREAPSCRPSRLRLSLYRGQDAPGRTRLEDTEAAGVLSACDMHASLSKCYTCVNSFKH